MDHEQSELDSRSRDEFQDLLDRHEREVQLGNVADPSGRRPRPPRRWFRPLMLFLATCLSTYLVGVTGYGWTGGLIYSAALMSILMCHEMGHFLQSVRYAVPASFPYFIPMPFPPIGTLGAVIVQQRGAGDRKALFDIAISGPLAGLCLALPMTYFGIQWSVVKPLQGFASAGALQLGEPLIFQWLIEHFHGVRPVGYDLAMHPIAHAGWVGIFITALNLVPVSQLDGGHIMYALLRKKAHVVAIGFLLLVVGYMIITGQYQWSLMVVLVTLMGPMHPPTTDDYVPLGWGRKMLGWLTMCFLIVGLTPNPISYYEPPRPSVPPAAQQMDVNPTSNVLGPR